MVQFGGDRFSASNAAVPLVFGGRFFVVEWGDPHPLLSVLIEDDGDIQAEVRRNEPAVEHASKNPAGIITVTEPGTGRFLYKLRPGGQASVAFGRLRRGELEILLNDERIRIIRRLADGTSKPVLKLSRNQFHGPCAGAVVRSDGSCTLGAPIPPAILRALDLLS